MLHAGTGVARGLLASSTGCRGTDTVASRRERQGDHSCNGEKGRTWRR